MGEQDERDPFPTHNDADKMVYEFKNSKNDPNRELTEAEAEAQLRERVGETGTDESTSTKSSTKTPTTKSAPTSKEK